MSLVCQADSSRQPSSRSSAGLQANSKKVGRWSEDCPEHSGVVVLSMGDTPLGFGVTARSTAEARKLDPTAVVAFRQGDVGEYLREEDTLFTT